jgi:hypothetical protein
MALGLFRKERKKYDSLGGVAFLNPATHLSQLNWLELRYPCKGINDGCGTDMVTVDLDTNQRLDREEEEGSYLLDV